MTKYLKYFISHTGSFIGVLMIPAAIKLMFMDGTQYLANNADKVGLTDRSVYGILSLLFFSTFINHIGYGDRGNDEDKSYFYYKNVEEVGESYVVDTVFAFIGILLFAIVYSNKF